MKPANGGASMATSSGSSMRPGYMRRREASINDIAIAESDRRFRWPLGIRPADHPGLPDHP